MGYNRARGNALQRGFWGIGIYHSKAEVNMGTLWRHALLYGAAFIFTIGRRYVKQASDTTATPRHIPLFEYTDFDLFQAARPVSVPLVAVEMCAQATDLPDYKHPQRAIYLLGAEDHGLPAEVLEHCQAAIVIPCPLPYSMNVAVADTLVMYDRYVKSKG